MIKVVLDTNVFVSAVLNPVGNPGRIIELVKQGRLKLIVSPDILAEIESTLSYPRLIKLHKKSSKWIKAFVKELSDKAIITPGTLELDAIKDDPSDNIYLACAVEGLANFIISGDQHLTKLKTFQRIRIVPPTRFLEIIQEEGFF